MYEFSWRSLLGITVSAATPGQRRWETSRALSRRWLTRLVRRHGHLSLSNPITRNTVTHVAVAGGQSGKACCLGDGTHHGSPHVSHATDFGTDRKRNPPRLIGSRWNRDRLRGACL